MPTRSDDRNFRLSRDVVPSRYRASLEVDLPGKAFRGSEEVTISVARPVREVALHALALEITRAELRQGSAIHRVGDRDSWESGIQNESGFFPGLVRICR